RRLLPYLRPHWRALVAGTVLAVVVSAAEGAIAWLVKPAMDGIFLRRDALMLKLIPLAVLAAYAVKGAGRFGQSYLMASVGERVLALIAMAVFPAAGLTVRAIGRKLYTINKRAQEKIAELNVILHESFAGTKIVKAFGRERLEQERFDQVNDRLLRLALRNQRTDQAAEPLMEVMGAVGLMGALWYGVYRVISGALTTGEFFSFTAAVLLLYGPARQLSRMVNTVQQSLGSVERVFEV